jgi:hypothetical protein
MPDVPAESRPPGEQGTEAVAVSGQERDVDEQPDPPAREAVGLPMMRKLIHDTLTIRSRIPATTAPAS